MSHSVNFFVMGVVALDKIQSKGHVLTHTDEDASTEMCFSASGWSSP